MRAYLILTAVVTLSSSAASADTIADIIQQQQNESSQFGSASVLRQELNRISSKTKAEVARPAADVPITAQKRALVREIGRCYGGAVILTDGQLAKASVAALRREADRCTTASSRVPREESTN